MNGKGNIMFYGRARRIAIAKVVGGTIIAILLFVLIFSIIFRKREISEKNVNYSYLTSYFVNKGYTEGYSLNIMHRLSEEDVIEFKTTSKAFVGYTNQTFRCVYDNNVLDPIESCTSTESVKLQNKSYLSVIEIAQADLNNAIAASGYIREDLLINYEWNKK